MTAKKTAAEMTIEELRTQNKQLEKIREFFVTLTGVDPNPPKPEPVKLPKEWKVFSVPMYNINERNKRIVITFRLAGQEKSTIGDILEIMDAGYPHKNKPIAVAFADKWEVAGLGHFSNWHIYGDIKSDDVPVKKGEVVEHPVIIEISKVNYVPLSDAPQYQSFEYKESESGYNGTVIVEFTGGTDPDKRVKIEPNQIFQFCWKAPMGAIEKPDDEGQQQELIRKTLEKTWNEKQFGPLCHYRFVEFTFRRWSIIYDRDDAVTIKIPEKFKQQMRSPVTVSA